MLEKYHKKFQTDDNFFSAGALPADMMSLELAALKEQVTLLKSNDTALQTAVKQEISALQMALTKETTALQTDLTQEITALKSNDIALQNTMVENQNIMTQQGKSAMKIRLIDFLQINYKFSLHPKC